MEIDNNGYDVGKYVLYSYGKSYSQTISKRICKIEKNLKSGFKISNDKNIFNYFDGTQRGLGNRMDIGTISRCEVISEEVATSLRKAWAIENKKIKIKSEIIEMFGKNTMDLDQLRRIKEIMEES